MNFLSKLTPLQASLLTALVLVIVYYFFIRKDEKSTPDVNVSVNTAQPASTASETAAS